MADCYGSHLGNGMPVAWVCTAVQAAQLMCHAATSRAVGLRQHAVPLVLCRLQLRPLRPALGAQSVAERSRRAPLPRLRRCQISLRPHRQTARHLISPLWLSLSQPPRVWLLHWPLLPLVRQLHRRVWLLWRQTRASRAAPTAPHCGLDLGARRPYQPLPGPCRWGLAWTCSRPPHSRCLWH